MALSFAFDPSRGESFDSTKRKRAMAEQIAANIFGKAPRNVGEGLNAIGQAFIARQIMGEATSAEKAGNASASDAMGSIFGSLSDFPDAPGAPRSSPVASSDPNAGSTIDFARAGNSSENKQAFVEALMPAAMEASQRTGVDPRIIVAQAAQETGWGKSAPGNNFFGIKSHGKGGGQNLTTHEVINGQRVKVNDSFRSFNSPGESVAGYADFLLENPRYRPMMQADGLDAQLQALGASGYATDPNYAQSVGAIARGLPMPAVAANEAMATGQPIQTASLDPSIGMATPQSAAPDQQFQIGAPAAETPAGQRMLSTMMDPQSMTGGAPIPMQAGSAAPQASPPLPFASMQPPAPAPVQVAQAQPMPEMAGNVPDMRGQPSGPSLQQLIQAASNPWLNENQRAVVNMMLEQQMQAQDPMRQLDMDYKRAQIGKLTRESEQGGNEIFGTPIYGRDPETGSTVLGAMGKDGQFHRLDTSGVEVTPGVTWQDFGTHRQAFDKSGAPVNGPVAKENFQESFDKGAGGEAGKAQAEAASNLPTDLATADQAITELDALISHPGLSAIAGPIDQFRPSFTMGAEGRDALARFNQAKGRAFLQAFGMLKGGGQITEIEGLKAEQAMARMDRAQSEPEFVQALKDFRDAVATGRDKLRQRAGQGGQAPAQAAPAAPQQEDPLGIR